MPCVNMARPASRVRGPVGADAGATHLGAAQLCFFLKCQLGQCLPGTLPEWLLVLRGIDALQSRLDLFILTWLTTSRSEGVAV